MKFICFGYADPARCQNLTEKEGAAGLEKCFAYDDQLRSGGHFIGGDALEMGKGVKLEFQNGAVQVTDLSMGSGQIVLGGILYLEARDLKHAIELVSKHPGVQMGPWEIRPADQKMNDLIEARGKAHAKQAAGR